MHHALCLPEIVRAILCSTPLEEQVLYPCLLVNRLFSAEAARLIWCCCDTSTSIGQCLIRLNEVDPHRAQSYANLIRELRFGEPASHDSSQSRSHEALANLSFPQLRKIDCCRVRGTLFDCDSVRHYIQISLRELTIWNANHFSDSFLQLLATRTGSNLRSLIVSLPTGQKNQLSEQALVKFLTNGACNRLETLRYASHLHWRNVSEPLAESLWTSQILDALSKLPKLEHLFVSNCLPNHIIQGHVATIRKEGSKRFSRLRYLHTSMYAAGLKMLLPQLTAIEMIALDQASHDIEFQRILCIFVMLQTEITSLVLQFADLDNKVPVDDLILFSHYYTNIKTLKLSIRPGLHRSSSPLVIEGLDDDSFEHFICNLPRLTDLTLPFTSPDCLTFRSLFSLATYCKDLQYCNIRADIRWEDFRRLSDQYYCFQALYCLNITSPSGTHHMEDVSEANQSQLEVNLKEVANIFMCSFPSVQRFCLNENHNDRLFEDVVRSMIERK